MKEVKELIGLGKNNIKILNVEDKKEKDKVVKVINLIGTTKKVKCPICGKYTKSIHDTLKPTKCKYIKVAEYDCYLSIIKRRFICHNCKKKVTENLGINNSKKTITNMLEIKIRKDLLKPNFNIKQIAEDNNISPDSVRCILKNVMSNHPDYLRTLPEVISLDEFKADTKYCKYAFIINDPIKKRTLDVLSSRKKDYLISYFTRVENRNNVKYVISDMYEPYLIVTKVMFSKAKYVVDRFHYIRSVTDALDKIRRRIQNEYGYNSKEYRLLKNKKNVSLLRKYNRDISWYVYTKRYEKNKLVYKLPINILHEMLEISDDLDRGYELKELFLDIVNHTTYEDAKEQLLIWVELCNESKIPEFIEAGKTIENWLEYIVNSFIDKRYSNGYTEGINNKIKVIKRNAYGYKSFQFFRLRILYILNKTLGGSNKKNDK